MFDEKRLLIAGLAIWTLISSTIFVIIMVKDDSKFLSFGPNEHNKLFGVTLNNWEKWSAVAIYTFISTCIASFAGDAIWPFITNVIMDYKSKHVPYSKNTCLIIIQIFTIYEVCFHVIGTFVTLTQLDFTIIRIVADLTINYFTTGWFLRGKVVDKVKYDEWKREEHETYNANDFAMCNLKSRASCDNFVCDDSLSNSMHAGKQQEQEKEHAQLLKT